MTFADEALVKDVDREREHVINAAHDAVEALHRVFLAVPSRPTGLSLSSRAVVRLVDEVLWVDAQLIEVLQLVDVTSETQPVLHMFTSSADVLDAEQICSIDPSRHQLISKVLFTNFDRHSRTWSAIPRSMSRSGLRRRSTKQAQRLQ